MCLVWPLVVQTAVICSSGCSSFVELTCWHLCHSQKWLIVSCSQPPWDPLSARISPYLRSTCSDTTAPLQPTGLLPSVSGQTQRRDRWTRYSFKSLSSKITLQETDGCSRASVLVSILQFLFISAGGGPTTQNLVLWSTLLLSGLHNTYKIRQGLVFVGCTLRVYTCFSALTHLVSNEWVINRFLLQGNN